MRMMSWEMAEKEAQKIGSFTKTAVKLAWTQAIILKFFSLVIHLQHPVECLMKKEAGKFLRILVFYTVTTIFNPPTPWQSAVDMVAHGSWCDLLVLQKLWFYVLTAAFDCSGASTETGHCFKPHRLMWFLWHLPKEFIKTKYLYPLFLIGSWHLKKCLSGPWLTTEITD